MENKLGKAILGTLLLLGLILKGKQRSREAEKLKQFAGGDKAIMGVIIGAVMLVMGALVLFVVGGVVAPGLYTEANSTMPIGANDTDALEMRTKATSSMVSMIGIGGMVLMIGGFGLIISSLWSSFGGVFAGKGGGGI